ncbi:signal peptidase II [Mycoplasma putrefaciens]|uniref:Lipoprotein signal peptidase n=1 Tax=Mycoplasma putrefaciens Mput9231 TaxID=1292033 RepID=M9WC99_9MOLU|nr:signal peptidase II [Mycoplasma putrefaciens]AGJ90777.1 Signal peptidase II [Mycoplasma putrefaciens Mput9231]
MWLKEKWLDLKVKIKNHNFQWKFKLIVCLPILVFLVASDWITKAIVVNNFNLGDHKVLINKFLHLRYTINLGMAYGGLQNSKTLVIVLASIVTLFMIILFIFLNAKRWLIPLTFILSGSIANLLARSWAPVNQDGIGGGVVDFLVWGFTLFRSDQYIFNLADLWVNCGIAIGIVVVIIELIIFLRTKFKRKEAN